MSHDYLFAVLPYLTTRRRVKVRGVEFRGSRDQDDLPSDVGKHLSALCQMFYLQDGLRIDDMTCAYLELPEEQDERRKLLRHLHEAHVLIAYLYSSPHPSGDVFLSFEYSSLFRFSLGDIPANPGMVSTGLVWQRNKYGDRVRRVDAREIPKNSLIPGYDATRNLTLSFWVAEGSRIYPELPHMGLNLSQDLSVDLQRYLDQPRHWALAEMYTSSRDDIPEIRKRVFVSLEWYLRSCREGTVDTEAIVNLGIGLESLLRVRSGPGVTERFKDAVLTLLGPVPRLEFWIDQFYSARSDAVHEGVASDLWFYPLDKDLLKKQRLSGEPIHPHRTLMEYGRRIFRLCLASVLSGSSHVRAIGLDALFVSNRERIQMICRILNDRKTTAHKRLMGVKQIVGELEEYSLTVMIPEVEVKSVLGAARLIVAAYAETHPGLPQAQQDAIRKIVSESPAKNSDQLDHIEDCANQIRSESATTGSQEAELKEIVLNFLDYVAKGGFKLRCYFEENQTAVPQVGSGHSSSAEGTKECGQGTGSKGPKSKSES